MPRTRARYDKFLDDLLSRDLTASARDLLEPIITYDGQHNGDLIHTLRTYFLCNQNASRTAEALYLHRNGLLYRLTRAEELLGNRLSCREVSLAVELALRLFERDESSS